MKHNYLFVIHSFDKKSNYVVMYLHNYLHNNGGKLTYKTITIDKYSCSVSMKYFTFSLFIYHEIVIKIGITNTKKAFYLLRMIKSTLDLV